MNKQTSAKLKFRSVALRSPTYLWLDYDIPSKLHLGFSSNLYVVPSSHEISLSPDLNNKSKIRFEAFS